MGEEGGAWRGLHQLYSQSVSNGHKDGQTEANLNAP